MFWNVLQIETRKTYHRLLPWLSLAVITIAIMFISTMLFSFRADLPSQTKTLLVWPGSFIFGLNYALGYTSWSAYGTYALIIITGVVFAQEYLWGTLSLLLSHGVSRSLVFLIKGLIALMTISLIVAVCLGSMGVLSIFFSLQMQGSLHLQQLNGGELFLSYIRTVYSMLPYAALTLLLVVISRSTAFAVGGTIACIAIVESTLSTVLPLFGSIFAKLVSYLPSELAASINNQNYALAHIQVPAAPSLADPRIAVLGIAGYTLFFFGLAFWLFRRQDLAK